MRIFILVLLSLFVINSCTKDKAVLVEKSSAPNTNNITNNDTTNTDTIPPIVLADSILYVDLQDTTLQSFVSYNSTWNCNRPVPQDSSAYDSLDVTSDGDYDIKILCSNSYQFTSASNPCANYSYLISFGVYSGGAITLSNGMVDTLSYGRVINSDAQFRDGGSALKVFTPGYAFCWPINKDYYVGIKLVRNGITMYGWVLVSLGSQFNSIVIKSYAINLRPGNDITAGQTN